jgi:hypothetical protein
MKLFILSASAIGILLLNACISFGDFNQEVVEGNGTVVERTRETADFSEIDISENIEARIKQADGHSLSVKTDSNLHEYIITEVDGNKLDIEVKDHYRLKPTEKIEVFITFEEIDEIEASSSSRVYTDSKIEASDMEIDVSSSADVELEIEADEITGDCSSGGSIKLKGKTEICRLDASSGGDIEAKDLMSKEVEADASSGGNITITALEELKADVSSGSDIDFYGDPDKIQIDESSGGDVDHKE